MPNVPATPATPPPAAPAAASINAAIPAKGATPAAGATPAVEETFDVQIDGKAEKRTRKELIDAYQLRQLSDKKRSEADRVLTEYKQLQEMGAKDPIKLMKAMGFDFDNIATQYLARKAEDSMKDPKVLEMEKKDAELAQYKKWVEEQKASQEKANKDRAIGQEKERLHKEIIDAIEEKKELGLPIDEHLIIAIAQDMLVQDKAKKPLNAKEALPQTYARTQKWLQGLASKMEGEAIVKWLGEDVAKKIRKYDLTQLKAKRAPVAQQSGSAVKPQASKETPKEKPYQTWSEFKANTLDKIK